MKKKFFSPLITHYKYTCFIIVLLVVLLDQFSKIYFQTILQGNKVIHICGTHFAQFILVHNSGAAFSLGTGQTWIITLIAVGITIFIVTLLSQRSSLWWIVGCSLILGGALGNLIDRIFRSPAPLHGEVIDFISIGWWPVFNLADSAITIGVICLLIANTQKIKNGHEPEKSHSEKL